MKRILSIDVGIKNLSYCYMESDGITNTKVIKWDNVAVMEGNCKKLKIETLTEQVLLTLQEHFDDSFEADVVLIENQPMLKNGNMKTVSVIIYSYFVMSKLQFGNIREVRFYSASNKLKCKKITDVEHEKKSTYKDRKSLSKEVAKRYIVDICPENLDWFLGQRKGDDIADAFLLGIHYIEVAF